MLVATCVLAGATVILAASGLVALLPWRGPRRSDRARRDQRPTVQTEERILKRAKGAFGWNAAATAGCGVAALALAAFINWANQ